MNLPNKLTLSRLCLAAIFLAVISWRARFHDTIALVLFLAASITDYFDGEIARRRKIITNFGILMDPLADKLLLVSSFILLGHMEKIPYWLVIITVSRDAIIVLGIVTLMLHQLRVEIKPLLLSKLNTLLQLLTIFVVLGSVYFTPPPWGLMVLFTLTAMLSIASGLHYILRGIRLWEAQRGNNDANAGA